MTLPLIVAVATLANLALVTTPLIIVKAVEPVTSPVCVALEINPLYRLFGALSPVLVPLKLVAETAPVNT